MDQLIKRVESGRAPIINGELVTFVWKGAHPPQLMGDFTDWENGEPLSLEKSGNNIWSRTLRFPLDAYLEYIYVRGRNRILDVYNPRLTPNGFGRYNHFFYMPEKKPTTLTIPGKGNLHGKITKRSVHTWELVGGKKRIVYFYAPPASGPTPLMVVLDGQDYLIRAKLPTIMDNLIAQGRIKPVSLALVENKNETRLLEYGCSEGNLTFLSEVILPLAYENLNLIDLSESPGEFAILGASMGGLMALYAGLRLSNIFGKVLIQSGGFVLGNRDMVVFDLVQDTVKKSLKLWMEVGRYDIQHLLDANRRMVELLQAREYDVMYREYNAGHNFSAWRNEIWHGLEHIFGT